MNTPKLLHIQALTKRFGGHTAVEDVSMELEHCQVHCIIGPNGAGKSTLLNMICGTLSPTSGRILFQGLDIVGLTKRKIAHLGIARKFQVPSVFESLTVRQNLDIAANGVPAKGHKESVDQILERIELVHAGSMLAGHLAHGQKQWLEIGMALAMAPQLLLLDEPTAGMTPDETAKTAALIRLLAGHVTVLAIEHDMAFVRALACETIVMHQGRVLARGSFESVAANETVCDVYLGRA
jgi:urea ABC transporter ATP-binding protein UrtD